MRLNDTEKDLIEILKNSSNNIDEHLVGKFVFEFIDLCLIWQELKVLGLFLIGDNLFLNVCVESY
jgi:hypothetical protein